MSATTAARPSLPLLLLLLVLVSAIPTLAGISEYGEDVRRHPNYVSFPAKENGTCFLRVPYDDNLAERITNGIVKLASGSPQDGVKTRSGSRAWVSVIDCCEGYVRNNETSACEAHCEEGCLGGTCTGPDVCTCEDGWRHEAGVCRAVCRRGCPRDAYCFAPDICTCQFGYAGDVDDCQPVCVGGCRNGDCVGPHDCRCHQGYYLNETQHCAPICQGGCPHGECTEPGLCTCYKGYLNPPNNPLSCVPDCPKTCKNGECFSPGVCTCRQGYTLSENDTCTPVCDKECTNGHCIAPNQCACESGFLMNYRSGECVPVSADVRTRLPSTTTIRSRNPLDPEYITPVPAVIGLNEESNSDRTGRPVSHGGDYENQGIQFVQGANRANNAHGTSSSYGNNQNNRTYGQRRPVPSENNNRPYGSYDRDQNQDVQRTINSQRPSAIERPEELDIREENNAPFISNRNNPVNDRPRTRRPPGTYASDHNPNPNPHDPTNPRVNSRNNQSENPQNSYPQGPFPIPTSDESEDSQQNHENPALHENNQENVRPQGRYPPHRYHPAQTEPPTENPHDVSSPRPDYENNRRPNRPQRPVDSRGQYPTRPTDPSENPHQDNYDNNGENVRPHGRYPPQRYYTTTADPREASSSPRPIDRNNERPIYQRPPTSHGPFPIQPSDQTENPQTENYDCNHPEHVTPPGWHPDRHPIRRPAQTQRPRENNEPHDLHQGNEDLYQSHDSERPRNNPSQTTENPLRPRDQSEPIPFHDNPGSRRYNAPPPVPRPTPSPRPTPPARPQNHPSQSVHVANYPYQQQGSNNASRPGANPYSRPDLAPIPVYPGVDLSYGPGEIFIVPGGGGGELPFSIDGPVQTQVVYGPFELYQPPVSLDAARLGNQQQGLTHGGGGGAGPEVSVPYGRPGVANGAAPDRQAVGPLCASPCLNGECVAPNRCACKPGYQLDVASPFENACVPVCYGGCPNGVCTAPNLCLCKFGFVKEYGVKGVQRCVPIV